MTYKKISFYLFIPTILIIMFPVITRIYHVYLYSQRPQVENFVPAEMKLFLSVGASFWHAQLSENGSIVCRWATLREPEHEMEKVVSPTPQDWKNFFDTCESLNVWNWRGNYRDKNLADGLQWGVLLNYPGRAVDINASNRYPPNAQRNESIEFQDFWDAVLCLLHQDRFWE